MAARNGGVVQRSLERTEYIQNTAEPLKLEQTREQKVGAVKQGQIGKGEGGRGKQDNKRRKSPERKMTSSSFSPNSDFHSGHFLERRGPTAEDAGPQTDAIK